MVDIDCRVDGCTCTLAAAARIELLVHTNNGEAVCKCHAAAARDLAVEPFHCIPQQRVGGTS